MQSGSAVLRKGCPQRAAAVGLAQPGFHNPLSCTRADSFAALSLRRGRPFWRYGLARTHAPAIQGPPSPRWVRTISQNQASHLRRRLGTVCCFCCSGRHPADRFGRCRRDGLLGSKSLCPPGPCDTQHLGREFDVMLHLICPLGHNAMPALARGLADLPKPPWWPHATFGAGVGRPPPTLPPL